MDTRGERPLSAKSIDDLVDARVRDVLGGLHARMTDQDLAIAELERRVRALEEALRLSTEAANGR